MTPTLSRLFPSTRHALGAACLALAALAAPFGAAAHGGRAGDVQIDHPYATPTPPGAKNGAAYLAGLKNTGPVPDKLLRASSPIAERTEIHTMSVDAGGVMRMREAGEIALPVNEKIEMRPGMGYHLMLIGLKQPLKEGERYPLTLEFERGGKTDVEIVVQKPASAGGHAEHAEHKH